MYLYNYSCIHIKVARSKVGSGSLQGSRSRQVRVASMMMAMMMAVMMMTATMMMAMMMMMVMMLPSHHPSFFAVHRPGSASWSSWPSSPAHDHMAILDVVVAESEVLVLQLHAVAGEVQLVQVVLSPLCPDVLLDDHAADVGLHGLH